MLQLATRGYYIATVHRVVNASTTKTRYSVPLFWNPRLDAEIGSVELPPTLRWDRPPPLTDSLTHGGTNRFLPIYGDNAFKSLARSHPRVTQRHHADLRVASNGQFVQREHDY
mmetsp:Transcript_35708/g.77938  ORF Transcript_35708/g.77938 Transcript_35708/m.77938 type:complete len:113 (-) Transcript_35708:388-726(-)